MEQNKTYVCRYKTGNKKSGQGIKDRKLIITKEPHRHRKYKKGLIIKAIDLFDRSTNHTKVFYLNNFITISEYNFNKGNEEATPPILN